MNAEDVNRWNYVPTSAPPFLPPWKPTFNMAMSTLNFPANFTGFFNVSLAARFGLNMFDQSNGQLEWSSYVYHYNQTNDMEAFLLKQIAMVNAINPESKSFMYRSGQCALSYVTLFREAINDPGKHDFWMKYRTGPKKGQIYSESSPGPMCYGKNGTEHPPSRGWWPKMPASENIVCGHDYFFDLTNPAAAEYYVTNALRLKDSSFDGFFIDDTEGLGTEHGAMIKATGMTQTEVDAWNAARLPVYDTMYKNLLTNGKFCWQMFRDADNNPPRTVGAVSRPTNTTCATWMRKSCAKSYDKVALMMTPSSDFFPPVPGARPGTIFPKPYSFHWLKQQLAAFLLIRGPHAFFGTGWGVGLVHEWNALYDIDFGVPVAKKNDNDGVCQEINPNVFYRAWTKYNVTLDCNKWDAIFTKL